MIFLAVGTQLPFDRLTKALDSWCANTGRGSEVFGQIGKVGPESFKPAHFEWQAQIGPDAFEAKVREADVIVSHAGMGTIITALYLKKPLVIMARRAHLNEHRNDHQFATLKRFRDRPGVFVIEHEDDLSGTLRHLFHEDVQMDDASVSQFADDKLIRKLRNFIYDHGA